MKLSCYICLLGLLLSPLAGCQSDKNKTTSGGQSNPSDTQRPAELLPSGQLTYTAPEDWVKQQPSSAMRKDQYVLPGIDGAENAELAVFFFPGTGGGVEENLKRWYGQFKQPDGSAMEDHVEREKITVNGLPVTVVYLTGTYLKSMSPMMAGGPTEEFPGYAMLGAIVETADAPWFLKATGPQQTIDRWRASFDTFVQSFRVE